MYEKAKKVYSTILNALKAVQLEEGLIGDNSATFSGEGAGNGSYDKLLPAQRLASKMNVMKFCPEGSSDSVCIELENYKYKKYTSDNKLEDASWDKKYPKIVLNDGSFIMVDARRCGDVITTTKVDEYGKPLTGSEAGTNTFTEPCAYIYFDVNGAKAPNVVAKDVFYIEVWTNKIRVPNHPNYKTYGGDKLQKIITNEV